MTSKKAASLCIGLGTALALFAAAAGLNRPTDSASKPATPTVQQFMHAEGSTSAARVEETPLKRITAPELPNGNVLPSPQELTQLEKEQQNLARPNVAPAPVNPDKVATPVAGENGEQMLIVNKTISKSLQKMNLMTEDGRVVSTRNLDQFRAVWSPNHGPSVADGPSSRNAFGCPVATTAPAASGEEAFHQDGDASLATRDGYSFDRLFGVPENFISGPGGPQVLESSLDTMTLASSTNVDGWTVGFVTNNTGLNRIRVRIYPGDFTGTQPGTPVTTRPALIDVSWCTPGAPTYIADEVFLLFTTTQFAAVNLPAGNYMYRISVRDDYPVPNDPNLHYSGLILAGTGFDEATGTFPQVNGNADNFILIGAGLPTYCGTPENPTPCTDAPVQSVTLFYGGNPYAGLYFLMHTKDFLEGKVNPDKSSTVGSGNFDITNTWIEGAAVACDIAGGSAVSNCTGTPNGVVDSNDATTLSNILATPGTLGMDFNNVNYTANRCADVDRNGRIDCNDWKTFVSLCGQSLAVPPAMNAPLTDPVLGSVVCNYGSNINFPPPPGTGSVPVGEVHATLPFNIPDNNFTGRTNTQTVADPGGANNGVADVDVDLDITHTNNSDLMIRLTHSNITKTLVNQPHARLFDGGNGMTGLRVLLDDGETDGSNFPGPGGANTATLTNARSSFRVFGRYKPVQKLASYVGRRVGGAGNGTGTGIGDWRLLISDRAGGDTGRARGWSLHIKLGPPVTGVVDGNQDVDGNPILDRYRTVGSCPTTGLGTTYFAFGQPTTPVVINAGNPVPAIPGSKFDINAAAFTGSVSFRGEPSEPFVSDYDMVLQRMGAIVLVSGGPVGSCPLPGGFGQSNPSCNFLDFVQLNLRSCQPIQVSYSDRPWSELWDVTATLAPGPQSGGKMSLYPNGAPETSANGRYWAALVYNPLFRFSKAADPSQFTTYDTIQDGLANGYLSLEMSTGDESSGANPGCAAAGGCLAVSSTVCRVPYVNDPDRAGQALGVLNTSGIVPGDASFVPNAAPGSPPTRCTAQFTSRSNLAVLRNWFQIQYRSPSSIPLCPSIPASTKDLPKELVRGTWTLGSARVDLATATGGCQIVTTLPPGTTTYDVSDCGTRQSQVEKRIDKITLNTALTTVKISQVRWRGIYINCDSTQNPPGGPNNTDDPPYGNGTNGSSTFVDHFTIEFWQNLGTAANPGLPNYTAPKPHADIATGQGDAYFSKIPLTGFAGLPADLTFVNVTLPVRVYEYAYTIPLTLEEDLTANDGAFWISIYNNTAHTPVDPTGDLCVPVGIGTIPQSNWRWQGTTSATPGVVQAQRTNCTTNARLSTLQLRNMSFCIATASSANTYRGSGVTDNVCAEAAEGLNYLVSGNAIQVNNDGSGTILINGETTAGLSLPFTRDRWNNVSTVFKTVPPANRYQYTSLAASNLLPTAPAVKTALQTLLGPKAAGYNCQLDSLIANSTGLSPVPNATSLQVDHVFAGKLNFDHPNTLGNIEQFCRQADLSEYGGPASTISAKDSLKNNLDVFGIALKPQNDSNFNSVGFKAGFTLFYVASQAKDCNNNGRDDQLDIDCGLGNTCGGIAGAGDCNANGIPDTCDTVPLPTGGGLADCDSNGIPDLCEPGCLPGATPPIPNACSILNGQPDIDSNGEPDACQTDCDGNGVIDGREIQLNPALDCDSNGIPDNCQTQGLPFVTPPAAFTSLITFDAPYYTLGALQTGLPTSGAAGTGQQGWKTIIGSEINVPGFGGLTPAIYPSAGALIVNTGLTPCTQPSFSGQWLEMPQQTSAGAHGVFSWGVLSPKMRSRVQTFTRFEIDANVESGTNDNDFHSCLLVSDNGAGFANPVAAPVIISGFSLTKVDTNNYNSSLAVWSQDPATNVVQIAQFGDFFPPNTCVKIRLELDSETANNPGSARFSIDRTGSGTNFEFLRSQRLFGNGFGGVPIRFAIGAAVNGGATAPTTNKKARWDNGRYQVATPFTVGAATCGGSGTRNGCRVRGVGVAQEPDCNCNGVPDNCDLGAVCTNAGSTYSAHPTPVTTQSVTTTRPCSPDCNTNGIPDECEVPVAATRVVMNHNFEANAQSPTFTNTSSIVGQPTADPLVAPVDATNDVTADGNPGWFVPVVDPDTLPDLANAPVSTLSPCPIVGGNEQSIGMFVDASRRVDGAAGVGGPWTLRSPVMNRPVQGIHFNRQRLTVDCLIQSGRATYQVRPIGDDPQLTALARNTAGTRVRLARAGINYNNDANANYGPQGFLPANQIQVAANVFADGTQMFAALNGNGGVPITWPNDTCFRIIVETDTCRTTTLVFPLTLGDDTLVGIDTNFDNIPENSFRLGSFTQLMRGVDLITDNAASGNVSQPGSAFFDNVRIDELDDHCDTPQCTTNDPGGTGSPCVVACATCRGDMNGDSKTDGRDVQKFVQCYIGGSVGAPGCGCSDMAGPGGVPASDGALTAADITRFVDKLLRRNGWTASPNCEAP